MYWLLAAPDSIGSHLVDRLLAEGEEVLAVDDLSSGRWETSMTPGRSHTGKFSFHRVDVKRPRSPI